MPDPVSDAVLRCRRRLRAAAFCRAGSVAMLWAAAVLATLMVAERLAERRLLPALAAWHWWVGVGVVAVLAGALAAAAVRVGDRVLIEHLEQRLQTRGLLLAAADGATLDPGFRRRLDEQLRRLPVALPSLRWRPLLWPPLAAAALLLLLQGWSMVAPAQPLRGAMARAVERLAEWVDELAELPAASEIHTRELQQAVADLQRRTAAADAAQWREVLWREIDQLEARVERERRLAGGSGSDPAASGPPTGPTAAAAMAPADVQAGLRDLAAIDAGAVERVLARLPEQQRATAAAAVARALGRRAGDRMAADGEAAAAAGQGDERPVGERPAADPAAVDPAAVDPVGAASPDPSPAASGPTDPSSTGPAGDAAAALAGLDESTRAALAAALGETAAELAADEGAIAALAGDADAADRQELRSDLGRLAERFGPEAAAQLADAMSGEPGDGTPGGAGMAAELAEAAAKLAESGALDELPSALQQAVLQAGLEALEGVDLETLQALLPDDLSQLRSMAESVAELAEKMPSRAGEPSPAGSGSHQQEGGQPGSGQPGQPESASPGLPQLTPERLAQFAELAAGLRQRLGAGGPGGPDRASGGEPGDAPAGSTGTSASARGGGRPGDAGRTDAGPGDAGQGGEASGAAGRGGEHAALRLTADSRGGVGARDLELPEPTLEQLPDEWTPVAVEKAAPEVGEARAATAPGRAGATGKGRATWQLRWKPRHREVIRRFFDGSDDKR